MREAEFVERINNLVVPVHKPSERMERLHRVLEDLEEEQMLNTEAECSDPVLDILIIRLHAYICSEVCAGNARLRKEHLGPNHHALCADATIV